ncbi:MAG TPA: transmembrane domain-containing protein [Pyrinomonadaceae bacterium]|nr:transmembrane domain-containing protein [Pyrinomonadaceae bacterium]
MEQETDFVHLFTQHPFLIFVIGGLLVMALLSSIGFLLERRAGKKKEETLSEEPSTSSAFS